MITVERYLVFYVENKYPGFGCSYFRERFDNLDDAISYVKSKSPKTKRGRENAGYWYEIIDLETVKEIKVDFEAQHK